MLTSEEQRALAALAALVLAGALLAWLDAREPRLLRLTLGDSLALGAVVSADSLDAPAPAPVQFAPDSGRSPAEAATRGPADAGGGSGHGATEKSAYALDGKLNLNSASADALEGLPGIGPKTAQRILADRRLHGPYRKTSDLRRVKGIGPKTLARLLPYITAGAVRDTAR